ncbi:MAG TPA: hypothetical protein ENG48_04520 [Candidatus Atribacteria bacterium]|nr:hypothetical protein [Candidatus Atribacteria bacterium]
MMQKFYFRSFSVLGVEVGIISNHQFILNYDEYFLDKGSHLHSLLSNFNRLEKIPFSFNHDIYLYLINIKGFPLEIEIGSRNIYCSGDILSFEKKTLDKRKSIFGNMGLFSKILLRHLEKKGIFTVHSTAMYSQIKKILYLVLGGSGSGKSTVLLAGLEKGLEVFGTELVHFQIKNEQILFYKGSIIMNCRKENLIEDFPELIDKFNIENLCKTKIQDIYCPVDMSNLQTENNIFKNPKIVLIFPRIEKFRKKVIISKMNTSDIQDLIFDNLCQKISPASLLYNKYFVASLDNKEAQMYRMKIAKEFCQKADIQSAWDILASPQNCLDKIL